MSEARWRIEALLRQPALAAVLGALNGDGEETRIVGGAVRNLLLGEPASDIDLATTALPAETMRRGKAAGLKSVPTGIDYGTVTLVGDHASFEVTTLRRDIETDGRHARVIFGRDFAQDALRRDFTVNALGLDRSGEIHDFCGGLDDLAARRIRFIGDATARIAEDYLRILRFFRFHARFGQGAPDAEGLAACIAGRAGLEGLSRERVRAEMLKLVVAPGAADAVAAMAGGGLLVPVLGCVPHVSRFKAVSNAADQSSALILRSRASGVSKDAPERAGGSFETRTASAPQDEGSVSEATGHIDPAFRLAALAVEVSEDAVRLRERLRLSNEEFDRIARLAAALEALAGRPGEPTLAALRHLAHRVGADAVAGGLIVLNVSAGPERRDRMQALIAGLGRTPPFLPIGRDVVARGVQPGPLVGRVLEQARRDWIEAGCPADAADQAGFVTRAVAALSG